MKAISLWQPWSSLWLSRRKIHETRHWPTRHRGKLLVHAAKRFERNSIEPGDPLAVILDDEFGEFWRGDLPIGALLGVVEIVDCVPTERIFADQMSGAAPWTPEQRADYECGDFADGRFGWKRGPVVWEFPEPIRYRGAQGLFEVPDHVFAGQLQRAKDARAA